MPEHPIARWHEKAQALGYPTIRALLIYYVVFQGKSSGYLARLLGFSRWSVVRRLEDYGLPSGRDKHLSQAEVVYWTKELRKEERK